jgi:Phage protein (N4 Gp49/phage Sf6 gene 66) family
MRSDTLKATDDYSAAKSTHPRVSLADMEGKIARHYYFTAGDAISAIVRGNAGEPPADPHTPRDPLDILTICILVMTNGFTVIGKSAPASPENFDAEKGQRFAYEDAIKQLWPLEGYALRERLSVA